MIAFQMNYIYHHMFYLRQKIAWQFNYSSVLFLRIFLDDISNLLSSFDIFVLPSFIGGTSNALIEAMACSRDIICSDISANRAIVTNDKEALPINPDDRDGFKEAILLLSSDEKIRSRLGHNAKINAEQYDEDIIFPKFLQYYQDLCKKLQGQKNI